MATQLTSHFSLEELVKTNTGLPNVPSEEVIANLQVLANALEVIRHALGDHPITVNSAYRSEAVNKEVGGVPTSRHLLGLAADIVCPAFGTPQDVCHEIVKAQIPFDQLIYEHTWVHFGLPEGQEGYRHEVLTLIAKGAYVRGIVG